MCTYNTYRGKKMTSDRCRTQFFPVAYRHRDVCRLEISTFPYDQSDSRYLRENVDHVFPRGHLERLCLVEAEVSQKSTPLMTVFFFITPVTSYIHTSAQDTCLTRKSHCTSWKYGLRKKRPSTTTTGCPHAVV